VLYRKWRPVASHFAVLVRRAYHAGVSYWRGLE
jgi:N-acetyl-anhydromuramyl-L-alanine amidase AmpD